MLLLCCAVVFYPCSSVRICPGTLFTKHNTSTPTTPTWCTHDRGPLLLFTPYDNIGPPPKHPPTADRRPNNINMRTHTFYTFISDIILRKSFSEPYVSKSSGCRRCGMMFCGRASANGTGSSSGITEWCVIKARSDVNSLVKPCRWLDRWYGVRVS